MQSTSGYISISTYPEPVMPPRFVIPHSALPTRPPVLFTVMVWLLIDRLDPAGWVIGMVWTLVVLLWCHALHRMGQEASKPLPGFGDEPKPCGQVPPKAPPPPAGEA
jgi:hypothetical protein